MTTNIILTSSVPGTTFTWTATATSGNIGGYSAGTGSVINQMLVNAGFDIDTVTYAIVPHANGCNGNVYYYHVAVFPIPDVSTSPLYKSICSNSATNISLTSHVAGTTFIWTATGYPASVSGYSSGTGSVINQVIVNSGTTTGSVTYNITPSANGCIGMITVYTVTVYPLPVPVITGPALVCVTSTGIYNTETGMTGYTWTVSAGGSIVGSSANSSVTVTWNDPGSQWVHVNYTNTNGCTGAGGTQYPVTVDSATIAGSVTGGTVISLGLSTDTLVLTGKRGTVLKWQKRPGNDPFADIPSSSGLLKYIEVPASAGSWEYRAMVQNGSCSVEYSIPDTVVVIAGPVARSWNGLQDGNWNKSGNWSPPGIPASIDDVTIPAGGALHAPVVSTNGLSCHNLHIIQGATVIINPGISLITLGDIIIDGP